MDDCKGIGMTEPTAMALLWEGRIPANRGPRPTLSLETVARAAIDVADAAGLAAVTMQAVAERLGVTKMALYRYVPGKTELVALMVDIGLGAPPGSRESGDGWRSELDGWARLLFERFMAHPWALEATVGTRSIGPNELEWLERAVAPLAGRGLTGQQVLDVAATLVGHVRTVAQQAAAMASVSPQAAMEGAIGSVLHGREDRFPALAEAMADPSGKGQALEFGLHCILSGVESLMGHRTGGG